MNIEDLWLGQKVRIIASASPWNWYHECIGEIHTVTEVRERYDDVIVDSGNCVDIEDIEPAE